MKIETEKALAVRQFDELVKTLIVLSAPADRQKEICGYGCPGDDMANDFDEYYTQARNLYVEHDLLTSEQLKVLDELDRYLEGRSGQWNAEFWQEPSSLTSHPDWESIRGLANACLVGLGKWHLDLEVSHEIENTLASDGKPLVIQHTHMKLKEKKGTQQDS